MVIAIVGLGPRGLVILERIISWFSINNSTDQKIQFLLFDNNGIGGSLVYNVKGDNLLLNTICSQITLYSGELTQGIGPIFSGPSLYDYCKQKQQKQLFNNGEITEFSYLPRSYFFKYMQDFANKQIDRLKTLNLDYKIICSEIVKLDYCTPSATEITLHSDDKKVYKADQVILCTGHGNQKNQYEDNCWSQVLNLDNIAEKIIPHKKMLIQGMGLVAFDIISELTENLGGRFIKKDNDLKYIASGLEPKMYIYSRTGLPLLGKGARHKQIPQHQARHFSITKINNILKTQNIFDFENDFLPLLLEELANKHTDMPDQKEFNFEKYFSPHRVISKNNFQEFYTDTVQYLQNDVLAAIEGIHSNAFKAVCEVIRDLRDNLRLCVEQKSLTSASHKKFLNYYNPIFNKLCVGPPYFRIEQLLALIKAEVVCLDVAFNPTVIKTNQGFVATSKFNDGSINEICADYLIVANIPEVDCLMANSPLWVELAKTGNCLFNNQDLRIGGVEIDQFSRITNNNGKILHDGLYAFGIPTEGAKYFTYVLPRPDVVSTFLKDANIIAKHIINKYTIGS